MSGDNDRVDNGGAGEDFMVTLKCDTDERSLQVNKTVLAKHSKYFEGLTSFDEKEISFDSKIVSFKALSFLVEFMDNPTGALDPSIDDLGELLPAADYLQIDSIIGFCINFMYAELVTRLIYYVQLKSDSISVAIFVDCCGSNRIEKFNTIELNGINKSDLILFLRIYPIVRRYETIHSYTHLEQCVDEYIESCKVPVSLMLLLACNFQRIQSDVLVLELDETRLFELLNSDFLQITEEEVLQTIKMWINYDLDVRRDSFPRLLRAMRPTNNVTIRFLMDELSCCCKAVAADCKCLVASDYLMAVLAQRLDPSYKNAKGPINLELRKRGLY